MLIADTNSNPVHGPTACHIITNKTHIMKKLFVKRGYFHRILPTPTPTVRMFFNFIFSHGQAVMLYFYTKVFIESFINFADTNFKRNKIQMA